LSALIGFLSLLHRWHWLQLCGTAASGAAVGWLLANGCNAVDWSVA